MRPLPRPTLRIFVTGLLAALPLLATLGIVGWALNLIWAWFGPSSLVGGAVAAIGFGMTGSPVMGYVFGIAFFVAAIFGLGLLVENGFERGLARLVNGIMNRIPVVRGVYDLVRRMVDLFSQRDEEGLKAMRSVWCHFGGIGGAAALALLSTPEPIVLGEKRYLGVLIPTAPVPIGGGLIYVPEEWVTPADVGVEAVTSLYVSMGVTSAKYLPTESNDVPPQPASKEA